MNKERSLEGLTSLVTGGNTGIGKVIATHLAKRGANVGVSYYQDEGVQEIVDIIEAQGVNAFAVRADISKEKDVNAMIRKTVKALGDINILVCNAAATDPSLAGKPHTLSEKKIMEQVNVTLAGTIRCMSAILKLMMEMPQDAHKRIIALSSVLAQRSIARQGVYSAAKRGIESFIESCAVEYGQYGIRINGVAPGAVRTPKYDTPKDRKYWANIVPSGRETLPEEVAKVVGWLAGEAPDAVHGAIIPVDGGLRLAFPHK